MAPANWLDRFNALDGLIGNKIAAIPSSSAVDLRLGTLECLLKRLQEFGKALFEHFYYGFPNFGTPRRTPNLVTSPDYPPEYVLRVILDQIAFDFDVISRALNQRINGPVTVQKKLVEADTITWLALELAKNANLIDIDTTAITYFKKSASIRVIPYAPVALIGIPFTCLQVDQDLLAIPHEVGHYVFWRGETGNKSIPEYLEQTLSGKSWCQRWSEEIFADVYGCLVGGALIAQDFQDLQLENRRDGFIDDDGSHPVPALRPKIYIKTLDLMENDLPTLNPDKIPLALTIPHLDSEWDVKITDVGTVRFQNGIKYIADLISSGLAIDPSKRVDQTIQEIYSIFIGSSAHDWWKNLIPTEDYSVIPNIREGLFENFSTFSGLLEITSPDSVIKASLKPADLICSDSGVQTMNDLITGWTTIGEAARNKWIADGKPVNEAPPDWKSVLKAGGWATKGPNGSPKVPT